MAKLEPPISHGYSPTTYCRRDAGDEGTNGRVSNNLDDLVNKTDSPFTLSVNSFPLPQKFHMPQIESYDRVKDPLDHLETFKTLMHLQGVPNEIMCRAFPTTLKGPARIWFNRLTPNPINTFKELNV